ncbi:MAG: hypothetical protein ACI3XD_02965 [Oscillospiraceae bacterium]
MSRIRKCAAFVFAMCLCWSASAPAFALSHASQYNPILEELGISENVFEEMPIEQRMLYQDIVAIIDTASDTKYFKEVYESDYAEFSTSLPTKNTTSTPVLIEIDQQEYELGKGSQNLDSTQGNVSTTSGSWYSMTTSVKKVSTLNGGFKYVVTNTLAINKSILSHDRTSYLGVSLNSNMSPLSGSEFMRLSYTLGVSNQSGVETSTHAQHKYNGGYAFDFDIGGMMISAEASMTFEVTTNVSNVTMLDGYGFGGYWNRTVTPTISIGSGGASITFTPSSGLIKANNTHAQLSI